MWALPEASTAREVNMPSIAVKWGYGSSKEHKLATVTVEKPGDLPAAINENARLISFPFGDG